MKKKLLLGLSLVGVAAAAASLATTLAAFNSVDSAVNVMTAGNVQIKLVEQQRNEDRTALVDFEQGKALTPLVGSAQGDKDIFGMPVAKNYQDKIISVKNTGANEAYVRVLMAVPASLDNTEAADSALHVNFGNKVNLEGEYTEAWGNNWKENWNWDYSSVGAAEITIDGVAYNVYCYTYEDVLATGAQTSAAIAGVYLDSNVNYENGAYVMNGEVIEGFNGVVTLPVIAQAVQVDGFDNAVTAFEEAFPYGENNVNVTKWFNNTGLVNAAPKSEAVRPAGYNPVEEGTNVVDGLTVIDNSDEKTNLRALYTGDGKKIVGSFTVTNSYLDGTYAMNVNGDGSGVLTVTNTALRGWVSYSGFESATFTNVTFGANSNPGIYNVVRPYSEVVFTNCDFDGTEFYLDKLPEGAKVTFVNCTMNGETIDSAEDLTITYGTADSVVIAKS